MFFYGFCRGNFRGFARENVVGNDMKNRRNRETPPFAKTQTAGILGFPQRNANEYGELQTSFA